MVVTRQIVFPGGSKQLPGYWAFLTVVDARQAILECSPYSFRTPRKSRDQHEIVETWS